jgi:hypothetical protein
VATLEAIVARVTDRIETSPKGWNSSESKKRELQMASECHAHRLLGPLKCRR